MFTVYATDTNYSDIAEGQQAGSFEDFVKKFGLEIVERNETGATVRAEWGNGEGYDTFEVAFEQKVQRNNSTKSIKANIAEKIENGFAETHVGYHSEYRFWNGYEQRGAYAQIAFPYGGTKRIYARSFAELEIMVLEYLEDLQENL